MVVVRRALAALALLTFGCSESPTPSDGGVLRDAGSRIDASSSDAGLGDAGSIDAGTDAGGPALLPDVVRIAYNFSVPNARPGVEAANLLANLQVTKATVVCAGAGSGGNLTLRVPDLTALLSEIGRDGSAPDSVGLGLTDVVDPLLSGPYGLVEQAVNGPARVVEWRRDYLLFW